jgi:NifU-like protein involved in Fe-S cluster formation
MSAATKLYTPELLALAVRLAAYPWSADFPLQGEARSASCGSTLAMGLTCDGQGRVERVGLRAQACAVGQAAAAIFAAAAPGLDFVPIASAEASLRRWLTRAGPAPDWPEIGLLEPARHYPGRHGAILLPWMAALRALPKPQEER